MTGKRPVIFCLIGNSDGFPMRQKASGRMRSPRKGRSLRDPARARRVRKRTLFYTGDGPVSQYLRQVFLLAEVGTQNRPLLFLPFVKKAEAGVYRSRKGKNLRRRRKAENGSGRLPIRKRKKSSPAENLRRRRKPKSETGSCFGGSQLFYREQDRIMH